MDREEFTRLFTAAVRSLEFDDLELSRMLKVSRPTIGRWARGDNVPAPLLRKPILDSLHSAAMTEVSRLWGAPLGTPEGDRLDVLATLIDTYEAKQYPMDPPA